MAGIVRQFDAFGGFVRAVGIFLIIGTGSTIGRDVGRAAAQSQH